MRLYTRTGATALTDSEYGTFEADEQGGFELPDDLGERLQRFHIGKQPQWEDEEQRNLRVVSEEMKRAQDPATLLAVVQQMASLVQHALPAPAAVEAPVMKQEPASVEPAPAPAKAPVKRATKRTATAPAAD